MSKTLVTVVLFALVILVAGTVYGYYGGIGRATDTITDTPVTSRSREPGSNMTMETPKPAPTGVVEANVDDVYLNDSVTLRVNYSIISDPIILSRAKYMVENCLSWNKSREDTNDIVVLKIRVELVNQGNRTIYYKTNYKCGISLRRTCEPMYMFLKPLTWDVKEPITLVQISSDTGHVLPLPIYCTLDLRFKPIPPQSKVVNEFYYIITTPFKGRIRVVASVCDQPLEHSCRLIKNNTHIEVTTSGFTATQSPKVKVLPLERVLEFLNNTSNIRKLVEDPKVITLLTGKGISPKLIIEDIMYRLSRNLGVVGIALDPKTSMFKSYVLSIQLVKLKMDGEELWVTDNQYLSIIKNRDNINAKCVEQLVINIHYIITMDNEVKITEVKTIDVPGCLVEV